MNIKEKNSFIWRFYIIILVITILDILDGCQKHYNDFPRKELGSNNEIWALQVVLPFVSEPVILSKIEQNVISHRWRKDKISKDIK